MKDPIEKLEDAVTKKIAGLMPPTYAVHPALKSLLDLGASTVLIAEWLGVTQGTVSSYANGLRGLPQKHEPALYEMLEAALARADYVLVKVREKAWPGGVQLVEPVDIDGERFTGVPTPEMLDQFEKDHLEGPRHLLETWKEHQAAQSSLRK